MMHLSEISEDELIDRAMRAYYRHARQLTPSPDAPSCACCRVKDGFVVVANTYGVLAEYRVGRKRLIRVASEQEGAH